MILSKEEIIELIKTKALAADYVRLEEQLQPASFDLTLKKVFGFTSQGAIDFDNKQRVISTAEELPFDAQEWVSLDPGTYKIQFNETLTLPLDVSGITLPRSSMMRCGAIMHSGFWDPGYSGKGECGIIVGGQGLRLKRNAKIAQVIFFRMSSAAKDGYSGMHQHENKHK